MKHKVQSEKISSRWALRDRDKAREEILKAAKARPIRHLMLNTNGVRLAREPGFVAALADLRPRNGEDTP